MTTPLLLASVTARVVRGHRVASGKGGDPRFPGGTLQMQAPHFLARGLDLSPYHAGTLNVSLAPARYRVLRPRLTLRAVKWHPVERAEDFSFFDVTVTTAQGERARGLIYRPHPDTKPGHFQPPDVLELLLPYLPGLAYGATLRVQCPADQIVFEAAETELPKAHDRSV